MPVQISTRRTAGHGLCSRSIGTWPGFHNCGSAKIAHTSTPLIAAAKSQRVFTQTTTATMPTAQHHAPERNNNCECAEHSRITRRMQRNLPFTHQTMTNTVPQPEAVAAASAPMD